MERTTGEDDDQEENDKVRLTAKQRLLSAGVMTATLSLLGFIQAGITVERNEAIPDFPESIDFHLSASSEAEIESVELEFEADALSCGESTTRAFPENFSPGTSVETEWKWDLRRTGTLPPGVTIRWSWTISDASGETHTTPEQSLTFTDKAHQWQSLDSDSLSVFWYSGEPDFAQDLLDTGEATLEKLQQTTGVSIEHKPQIYIYANPSEMQSATLFAPDWSGGRAFPRYSTVIIAVGPNELEWGRRVLSHELSHVVIGYYTFSCINSTPIWLDEGLAMYAEGEVEPYYASLLSDSIAEDSLFSVRELGTMFSNDPGLATLAYAQSLSLVQYLIEQHGQEKMLSLLEEFKDGAPEDRALTTVYGMDRDGLEAAWRDWAGAAPMQSTASPGATPTRTPFPTLAPITGPVAAPSEAPQVAEHSPSSHDEAPTGQSETQAPPTLVTALTVGGGCLLALVVIALGGWLIWRRRRAAES